MKRNDYSNYNRGQEISGVTFQQHQNQVIESLNTVMLSLGLDANEKTVLWGLQNSGSGSSYNISAGAIFTGSEIFLVDAFSATEAVNVPVLNPVTLDVGDPVRFADGAIEAVHKDHKYEISMGAENSGEVNYADLKQLKDVLSVMLDVDAKLNTFKSEIVAGASEGFDTLAEIQLALGGDPDFATNISGQVSAKASQASHDALNTRVTVNETVLANIEDYRGTGYSRHSGTSEINNTDSGYQTILSETGKTIVFPLAISALDLEVPATGTRQVMVFVSFMANKQGEGQDGFKAHLKRRYVGETNWTTFRLHNFTVYGHMQFNMRACVTLNATPTNNMEFALEIEPTGPSGHPFYISQDAFITFDYWIN